MESELPGIITGKVPLHFVIQSFVSGLIVLFFSPMRYFLVHASASWLIYPFSLTSPTDVLQSFLVILFLSLCLGVPISLASPIMSKDKGVNGKIMNLARALTDQIGKKEVEEADRTKEKDDKKAYTAALKDAGFHRWLKETGFVSYLELDYAKEAIVAGLLISSELVIIINIIYLCFLKYLCLLNFICHLNPIYLRCDIVSASARMLLINASVFVWPALGFLLVVVILAWAYNRYYYRGQAITTLKSLSSMYDQQKGSRAQRYDFE
jgi:hypothetical protein